MQELTETQKRVLDEIVEYLDDQGIPPTVRELQERLGYSSTRTVQEHLDNLEERGAIKRTPNTPRSIRVAEKRVR